MTNAYFYSSTAVQTSLTGGISNSSLTAQVASTVGWPSSYPYVVAIDYGGAAEELCTVTNNSAGVLTITRAFDSTSAQSHSIGAVVRHVYCANDATAFRTHEAATAAIHGVAGTIVGTSDTQTLSNKTLTSPTITGGTFTGTSAFAGATFSGSVALNGGGSWTGTLTGTGNLVVNGSATGTVVAVTNGISGQTADLQDWQVNGSTLAFMGNTGIVHTAGAVMTGTASLQPSATGTVALSSNITGSQSFDNFRIYGDGKHEWGTGSLARDTNLYRVGAGSLRTDTAFTSGGNMTVLGTSFSAVQGTFATTANSGNFNVTTTMVTNATGSHYYATRGGTEVFSVLQNGSIFGLDMQVSENEDTTSRTTTSLTYVAVGTLTGTCTVPESGKVLVMLRCTSRNSTTNNSITSFDATGSVSGSRYAANDAAALIVNGTNDIALMLVKVVTGTTGETLTVTPKHRVNSASTMTIDYRDLVMMPLLG